MVSLYELYTKIINNKAIMNNIMLYESLVLIRRIFDVESNFEIKPYTTDISYRIDFLKSVKKCISYSYFSSNFVYDYYSFINQINNLIDKEIKKLSTSNTHTSVYS